MEEGRNWETFDLILAIIKRVIDKVRCTTEEKGSRSYKSRNSVKLNVKSFNDDDSYDEDINIFLKMGMEKGICFLVIPS